MVFDNNTTAPPPVDNSGGGSSGGGNGWVGMAQQLNSALQSLGATATATAQTVKQAAQSMKKDFDDANQRLRTGLGDLQSYIDKSSGPFKDEIELQLDLLRTGGIRLDQFIAKVGDWKVVTENGVKTIRELLDKAGGDVRGFTGDIEKLAVEIAKGSKTVGDGLQFLKDKGGILTEQLVSLIEALQRGEGSIDRVKAALEALARVAGPNSPLVDLGNVLLNGLQQGQS